MKGFKVIQKYRDNSLYYVIYKDKQGRRQIASSPDNFEKAEIQAKKNYRRLK